MTLEVTTSRTRRPAERTPTRLPEPTAGPVGAPDAGPVGVRAAGRAPDRTADRVRELAERRALATAPGGPRRRGEYGARERIDLLLDAGSFTETGLFVRARPAGDGAHRPHGDGVVTGHGTIDGRPVCVFAQDATVFGGSMGEAFGEKTLALMDLALKTGCPVIGLNDGGGARIQEGVASLALYAELVRRNVRASGVIPQISVVLGPCAGGAAHSPAITDFTVMVDGASHLFVTGPDVIETVTGERTSAEELGGARTSNTVNGNAHFLAAGEVDALDTVRDLLSYLPANNLERPPRYAPGTAPDGAVLDTVVPDRLGQAHDMRDVLRAVVDDGELLQVQELLAPNIVCALALVEGAPVGVVANQPLHAAGVLDIDASDLSAAPNFAYDYCASAVTEAQKAGLRLDGVAALINGSEPVRPGTADRFHAAFAAQGLPAGTHCPSYGLAEATVFVSAARPGEPVRGIALDRDALATGKALPARPDDPRAVLLAGCGTPAGQGSGSSTPCPVPRWRRARSARSGCGAPTWGAATGTRSGRRVGCSAPCSPTPPRVPAGGCAPAIWGRSWTADWSSPGG